MSILNELFSFYVVMLYLFTAVFIPLIVAFVISAAVVIGPFYLIRYFLTKAKGSL